MMHILTAQNSGDYSELMEGVWRFRHRQFVERLGWTELDSEDGREKDRFDTDDTVHLVLARGLEIVGYSRLLRTSRPHLLSDVYPEIMDGRDWPRADDIYEWTRCICADGAEAFGGVQASHLLITGVLEFCLTSGIRGMIVETHPRLVNWMRETGYEVETLNAPQTFNSVPVVPVHIRATPAALARHHHMFGIGGSVLSIGDGLVNPVSGLGELNRLPGLDVSEGLPPLTHVAGIDFATMQEAGDPSG